MTFSAESMRGRLVLMALAPHQKAVVELATINGRVTDMIQRLRKFAPHPQIDAAIAELERMRGPLTRVHELITDLPPTYSPHESKIATTNIVVGARVAIREAHRAKYKGMLNEEEMQDLEVVAVGASCGVKTRSGVQMIVPRGHLITAATKEAGDGGNAQ